MELSKKNQYATAALAGVLSLSLASAVLASDSGSSEHGEKNGCKSTDGKEKHACKGQNSCKGQGADGKNECKGHGSCRTDGN
ncbi:MAG: hypothetical protein H2057_03645 [Alphaproteobacteria bacterium]|nr:hypothetical protein [Alphaproteobacteria bacterium]